MTQPMQERERNPLSEGQLVRSKAGHDQGDYFLVLELLDGDHVALVDGKRRPLEHPKKKKVKHLQPCRKLVAGFSTMKEDPDFNNARIRALIRAYTSEKEEACRQKM